MSVFAASKHLINVAMEAKVVFEQVVERGCGLDVHKEEITATISGKGIKTETRRFSAYTRSLISLRDWLLKQCVTHVAMESTGVYWKPVFNVLGDHFKILLVNARHVKNVPGRKQTKTTVNGWQNF